MMKLFQINALIILLLSFQKPAPSTALLKKEIEQIVANKNAVVGVSIIGNKGQDTLSFNGNKKVPLQSVFKLHIALAVLSEIDKGKLSLDQKIKITKKELPPKDVWSPLRDKNPQGGYFSISTLIQYSICQSDNLACDVLIKLIGTPQTIDDYFKKNHINDINIVFNEADMQSKWENMFQNWTTPIAASKTLELFYNNTNNLLSKKMYDFFWTTMKETSTGVKRLKGLLPKGTLLAHKTGSSGTNKEGLTPSTNDIGIVFLPNGNYFIISVFIVDSRETQQTNEALIAQIGKATYDYYIKP